MTIGENLQIVRGEGCGFRPGESPNDLESAQRRVSAWIEQNGADSDEPPSNWTSPDAPCAKFDDLRKPLLSDISVKIDAAEPWADGFRRALRFWNTVVAANLNEETDLTVCSVRISAMDKTKTSPIQKIAWGYALLFLGVYALDYVPGTMDANGNSKKAARLYFWMLGVVYAVDVITYVFTHLHTISPMSNFLVNVPHTIIFISALVIAANVDKGPNGAIRVGA